MTAPQTPQRAAIAVFGLFGEGGLLTDVSHCERIYDRAALYHRVITPHRRADLHQFFLVEDGGFHLTVDGESHALAAPILLSIPRQAVHGFTFATGTWGYVLTLPLSEFGDVFGASNTLAPQLSRWTAVAGLAFVQAMAALYDEHQQHRPFRTVKLRALAQQIACGVAQQASLAQAAPMTRQAARMAQVDALVQAHMRRHWKVTDYAAALSVTPVHLNRVTRETTGLSVLQLVEQRLFQEACRLLAYTPATLAEVAYDMGFDDPSYFSRAFHRRIGMSPAQYRRRANGTDLAVGPK